MPICRSEVWPAAGGSFAWIPVGIISYALQRSKRRKKKNVNVVAPQVQQAYGLEPQTAQGQIETSYLLFLGLVFVFIILEGLFIATSVRNHPTHVQGASIHATSKA